jgi:hypothetical protein
MDSKSISERLRKESYRPGLKRPPYGFLDTIAPAIAEAMSWHEHPRHLCLASGKRRAKGESCGGSEGGEAPPGELIAKKKNREILKKMLTIFAQCMLCLNKNRD